MRLIDADNLIKTLNSVCYGENIWGDVIKTMVIAYKEMVVSQPTIDPVKYGHWVDEEFNECHCSECGYKTELINVSAYCPACGAKMDEAIE